MPQATFTVKYVNPPKVNERTGQAARSATVRDDAGGYWGIHPGDMNKFVVGQAVTVDYIQNGKYYNVTGIVGQQAPANPQAQQVVRQLHQTAQRNSGLQDRPIGNPQADPRKSEDIFVCGVVNHAIAHQSYPLLSAELATLIANARWAWRNGEPEARPCERNEAPFPGSPDDYGADPRG